MACPKCFPGNFVAIVTESLYNNPRMKFLCLFLFASTIEFYGFPLPYICDLRLALDESSELQQMSFKQTNGVV